MNTVLKFIRLLVRFANGDISRENDKIDLISTFASCRDCEGLILDFSEVYDRMELLKLELLWKVEKLGNVMRLPEKVPSRVKLLRKHFIGKLDIDRNNGTENELQVFKELSRDIMRNCK